MSVQGSHVNDFMPRDRDSLIAAYAEGHADGRERFDRLWDAADAYRRRGIPLPLAVQFAVLDVYLDQAPVAC